MPAFIIIHFFVCDVYALSRSFASSLQWEQPLAVAEPVPEEEESMVTVGLVVRLEAKPGREADVRQFLEDGFAVVQEEPATTAWFAIQWGPTTFGIVDFFPDEAGRD